MSAVAFLNTLRPQVPPQLQPKIDSFITLYDKKLWHQLTVELEDFVHHKESARFLQPIYSNFIADFEKEINQLSLVKIAHAVSKQLKDANQAFEFMTSVANKVVDCQEALVVARLEAANYKLLQGDVEFTETVIEECNKIIDKMMFVEPFLQATFYRVVTDFEKIKANYTGYYKNALLYLACVDVDKMELNEKVQRAVDLGLAALLSDKIYNFGELLLHPILEALSGPNEWIRHALFAFNCGDLQKFEQQSSVFANHTLLNQQAGFLKQKISLMALIECAFKRQGQGRSIPFAVISQETKIPENEIEFLVMKALSLNIIKGSIDQVNQVVNINWVQPRVLNREQIGSVKNSISQWRERISEIVALAETETKEILVQ
ncbi:hypothetical protein O9G_005315 [Rozella allomycis CSF55]|uniref:PCI domain-containing protein n=1 Tax=Rozella allomycis (strain CSF55) TaxID=988480 RepID=A0A075B596_ROZAC|nr:hypothetical protein O9G_005315 [Rozella allomycis CSF55]|eukprot:EPZ37009.1 hypothetical protein O9G_005315 [Rozella allomycis CSF55]